MQQCFGIFGSQAFGDVRDGIDIAQLVVDHHHADQGCVGPHGLQHLLCRDIAFAVGSDAGYLIALLLHPLAALQHGAVLHSGGDDVAAQMAVLPAGCLDGPVVALRAAGGEKQLLRLTAQGVRHGFPPALHLLFHVQAQLVLRAGIAELIRQNFIHGVRYLPGDGGGGSVVQINHRDNSFSWDLP